MGVVVINVEADRLREPAAWLMVAAASAGVLVGIERLLFGVSSSFGSSFATRAAGYLDELASPVAAALLVGAMLLASHFGPVIGRLKLMAQVASGTLALSTLFGTIGLLGGLFAGRTDFRERVEFLLVSTPALALTVIALLYLLPKAISAKPQAGGFGAEGGFGSLQEQRPYEQYAPPQGGQAYAQGASVPQPGFPLQDQAPQGGHASQPGFPSHDHAPQGAPVPQPGFPLQDQAPQGGHAHPQQAQPAPVPQPPYALPPAPSSTAASEKYGQQQAQGYAPQTGDGYPQVTPPVESQPSQPYGAQPASYAPAPAAPAHAHPAPQVLSASPTPAETYTPSPYVPADVQPPAPAKPYEPAAAYEPPIYAAPMEQPQAQPQSQGYADVQVPGYAQPADAQLPGYAQPADTQLPGYAPQPEQQVPFYPAPSEAPASAPYAPADSHPHASFDSQPQSSFPKPPENYGQPFTGYSGAEFAPQTEPNLHYPAPDPVDPRSQQMAQAYQQAESYQQQSQGTEPQLRVPEYTSPQASQASGTYDDPFGHPQTPQVPQTPAPAQPYHQQSAHQQAGHHWESPAETTLRFDPNAYQGDPLSDPSLSLRPWDSQPAIDPTAIYKPERSVQVTGEETPDRERVGPGQEQNMSWYGSDRREH
ncbi:hypothetical protein [Streptosporangium sp. NPDC000396]|uniref:hypothetical protein n=1 Tax=Streptosporangium sp. NPDC000396 TaxID=3366185 RepID=UPI003682ECAD